jgi:hypothetical protein
MHFQADADTDDHVSLHAEVGIRTILLAVSE